MTHSRAVHCNRAGLQASFNNACFLFVEKTRSKRRNHICVMKVIRKWEQFGHVIMIIFSDSRDGFNVGVLKWIRQLWCITNSQGLSSASCRACPSYGNSRCKQPDTNVNLACNNHHCPNWRVQCEHNHNSEDVFTPFETSLWRNKEHQWFTTQLPYKIPSSSCIIVRLAICYSARSAFVIQGYTFLRGLSVKVHTDREALVTGVQVKWANNDHGVLSGSGLSLKGTPANNRWEVDVFK
jgi:hypothetical protein